MPKSVLEANYPFLKDKRRENKHGLLSNYLVFGLAIYVAISMVTEGVPFAGLASKLGLVTFVETPSSLQAVDLTPTLSAMDIASTQILEISENLTATPTPLQVSVNVNYPTAIPVQATLTPYPTQTAYPTQRPIKGDLMAVGYSYYWPPFGPPNCHPANWHDNYCENITGSGLGWQEYVGRGVAVLTDWLQDGTVSYGDTIRVISPYQVAGDYVVLDACGGCDKGDGYVYIDFLDNQMRLNWTAPVLIEIIRADA